MSLKEAQDMAKVMRWTVKCNTLKIERNKQYQATFNTFTFLPGQERGSYPGALIGIPRMINARDDDRGSRFLEGYIWEKADSSVCQ